MALTLQTRTRQATRAARSAPAMSLHAVAAAADTTGRSLVDVLGNLQQRGRCAALAADTATSAAISMRVVGVAWKLCPPGMRRLAAMDRFAVVRAAAAGTAAWHGRDLDLEWRPAPRSTCAAAARSVAHSFIDAAADNKMCPPTILAALAQHDDWRIRETVAENPLCDRGLLTVLSHDPSWRVGLSVASNPNTAATTVAAMARRHSSDEVRETAAANPNCPTGLLAELGQDNDWIIRRGVARNLNCPTGVLVELARDNPAVRESVALNPNCPTGTLTEIGEDSDRMVRCAVVENSSCDPVFLAAAAADRSLEFELRVAAVRNPHCEPATLAELASDPNWSVRWAVAENPRTPQSSLTQMASDFDVRRAVAHNPSTESATLAGLASDPHPGYASSGRRSQELPPIHLVRNSQKIPSLAGDPAETVCTNRVPCPRSPGRWSVTSVGGVAWRSCIRVIVGNDCQSVF